MKTILDRAEKYGRAAGITGLGHYKSAEIAEKRDRAIGLPSVALSAIVATSIFSTLSESVHFGWRIATGVGALAAAILAAMQAFLSYGDLAERHHTAGARYGDVRRRLDLFVVQYAEAEQATKDEALKELKSLAKELGKLASDSPTLAGRVYDEARVEFIQGLPDPERTKDS